jgi:hypothetical protein
MPRGEYSSLGSTLAEQFRRNERQLSDRTCPSPASPLSARTTHETNVRTVANPPISVIDACRWHVRFPGVDQAGRITEMGAEPPARAHFLFVRLLSNSTNRIATAGWRQCAKPLAIQHNMERMDMVEVPVELCHAQGQGVRRQTRKGGRTAEVA